MQTDDVNAALERFEQLQAFLDHDPGNLALLLDAAEAAIDADRENEAGALIDRAATIAPEDHRVRSMTGLLAMRNRRFDLASSIYSALLKDGEDDPAIRFNLAWSRAMEKDERGAIAALDAATCAALPRAAALDVQLRHSTGDLAAALKHGKSYLERFPDDRAVNAAMSVLAIDLEDEALAARCAAAAPDHPDALATLGTLALDDDPVAAADLFDRALSRNPDVPRAWVGRGLARLVSGDPSQAPADIDRGAAMFGDHLGSWIAAGWAWFVTGDHAAARTRFERALAIDPTFAETHGSLAVLDVLSGNVDIARSEIEVALRLDRQCYSAALAQALVSAGDGNSEASRRIVERALQTPIDGSGRTIAHALVRMQARRGSA